VTNAPWGSGRADDDRGQSRPSWLSGRNAAVLIVLAIAIVPLSRELTRPPANPALGWGHQAVAEAKLLKLCDSPDPLPGSTTTATCAFGSGDVVVSTSTNETNQRLLFTREKDANPQGCLVVGDGFLVSAPSAALTQAVGDVRSYASSYGAYLAGTC
jgi:hypothetical protein